MEIAGPVLTVAVAVVAVLALVVVAFVYAKVRFKIATPDEARAMLGLKGRDKVGF